MTHGRKYGDKASYPICVWNGIFDHFQKIGLALWEFLWCIDKITIEKDGIGWVFGKTPVKVARIASDFGICEKTVRLHLNQLKTFGYISTRKTPFGLVIGVKNSRKIWAPNSERPSGKELPEASTGSGNSFPETAQKLPEGLPKNYRSKEDKAVDKAIDSGGACPCPVWEETGVDPKRLPGPFRKLCEEHWRVRDGGASLFDFMGTVLDAWDVLGNAKYPPVWARRKAEIGRAAPVKQAPKPPELESIPWKK
jgi:hypothetical protein